MMPGPGDFKETTLPLSEEQAKAEVDAYFAAHPGREVIWFDDPDNRAWCDKCLLPSGFAVTMTGIMLHRLNGPFRSFACADCGTKTRTRL